MKYTLTQNDLISDAVTRHPAISKLLAEYGLVCVNCPLNRFETVGEGAQLHGMTEQEITKMIADINAEIQSENF